MGRKSTVIVLEREMVESGAFAQLTGAAPRVLLIYLGKRVIQKQKMGKRKEAVCVNNGRITFGWREAEKKWGMSKGRFGRALDQLVQFGFIDIEHSGGGCEGDASLYAISDRWRDYGKDTFKEKQRPRDKRMIGWRKGKNDSSPAKKTKAT